MLERKIHSSKQLEKEKWSNGGQLRAARQLIVRNSLLENKSPADQIFFRNTTTGCNKQAAAQHLPQNGIGSRLFYMKKLHDLRLRDESILLNGFQNHQLLWIVPRLWCACAAMGQL